MTLESHLPVILLKHPGSTFATELKEAKKKNETTEMDVYSGFASPGYGLASREVERCGNR